ncbi:MAG: hypothetical protein ACREBG_23050 [Pyrinomonadaceae bacterium]
MPNGNDIIIKGGSAEVNFDDRIFVQDPQNPHRYGNAEKTITRVVITGDITFDSGDKPGGLQCEIVAHCS